MTRGQDTNSAAIRALEATLAEQHEAYVALRRLLAKRREAIRTADLTTLSAAVDQERHALARIADLDRRRAAAVAALARQLGVPGGVPGGIPSGMPSGVPTAAKEGGEPPLSALLGRLDRATAERLESRATTLRIEVESCRRESGVVRLAAEALAQHLNGLVQGVQAALMHVKTYSRAGRLSSAVPLRSVLDLRS